MIIDQHSPAQIVVATGLREKPDTDRRVQRPAEERTTPRSARPSCHTWNFKGRVTQWIQQQTASLAASWSLSSVAEQGSQPWATVTIALRRDTCRTMSYAVISSRQVKDCWPGVQFTGDRRRGRGSTHSCAVGAAGALGAAEPEGDELGHDFSTSISI